MLAGPLIYAGPFLYTHMAVFDSPKYTNIKYYKYYVPRFKQQIRFDFLALII